MPGETSLNTLLRTLKATLQSPTYVFISVPNDQIVPPFPIPFSEVQMWFCESEGATLIVPLRMAEKFNFDYTYKCRMVTLNVHSSLEAVGFMAAVATRLAEEGLSSNPVSAFYHDHLFVKEEESERVVKVLENMAREANGITC